MAASTLDETGLRLLEQDEDIMSEAADLATNRGATAVPAVLVRAPQREADIPLNYRPGGHRPSATTRRLLEEAGGLPALKRFTTIFYQECFANQWIDQFIREHGTFHSERMANWIGEKFGAGTPWTEERRTREVCPFMAHGHRLQSAHDRSSAHHAAWHSPKRPASKFGQHFKLDDCRVWMRLNFWSMRRAGVAEASPAFFRYYVKFIGHFVSVYERSATQFARDAARWSEDPNNPEEYLANGRRMPDVEGVGLRQALADIPHEERTDARTGEWPYGHH